MAPVLSGLVNVQSLYYYHINKFNLYGFSGKSAQGIVQLSIARICFCLSLSEKKFPGTPACGN